MVDKVLSLQSKIDAERTSSLGNGCRVHGGELNKCLGNRRSYEKIKAEASDLYRCVFAMQGKENL